MTRAALSLLAVLVVSASCARHSPSSATEHPPFPPYEGGEPDEGDAAAEYRAPPPRGAAAADAPTDGAPATPLAAEASERLPALDAAPPTEDFDIDAASPYDDPAPIEAPHPMHGGGILTAGVFDDTLNPDVLQRFAATMRHTSTVAEFFVDPLTVITVTDAQGRPIPHAHVHTGRHLVTRTDGRVVLTRADWGGRTGGVRRVTVTAHGRVHVARVRVGDNDATIRMPYRLSDAPPTALDVALVVDATGSMGDEIAYLQAEFRSIAAAIDTVFADVDQRWALVMYRDRGDDFVTRTYDFTADATAFDRTLRMQDAYGGGDYPEAMDTALEDVAGLSWRPGNVARVTFLVADAPPHPHRARAALRAADTLRQRGVVTYPVAASGVASQAEMVMRAAAAMSGGQYIFLTDDSGVGLPHAEPHIPCYAVEHLRDAMIRMIRSELSGQRIEPSPDRALRTVGRSRHGVCRGGHRTQSVGQGPYAD